MTDDHALPFQPAVAAFQPAALPAELVTITCHHYPNLAVKHSLLGVVKQQPSS